MTMLLYDGSFEGFLTAVFDIYDQKLSDVCIRKQHLGENSLWGETILIETQTDKAARVWEGLKKRTNEEAGKHFYANYLSELPHEEDNMLEYVRYVFASREDVSKDFSHPSVLRVAKVAKMVGREKHRMEAFVRFQLTAHDVWYATIEPDFNVLPLIAKHFKSRYADQKWLIVDVKRGYGLYYDLTTIEILHDEALQEKVQFNSSEQAYQRLWKTYFTNTNIVERRNIKLHVQHVPLRYWKYLSEKKQ